METPSQPLPWSHVTRVGGGSGAGGWRKGGGEGNTLTFLHICGLSQWVVCLPLFYHCSQERLILDMLRYARCCTKCLYIYFETVLLGSSGCLHTLCPPDSAYQVLGFQPMPSHSVLSVFYFLILCSLKND